MNIGDIVEVTFYDHERVDNVENKDALNGSLEIVKAYGVFMGETSECYIISNWFSTSTSDIYRIIKGCVVETKVYKPFVI